MILCFHRRQFGLLRWDTYLRCCWLSYYPTIGAFSSATFLAETVVFLLILCLGFSVSLEFCLSLLLSQEIEKLESSSSWKMLEGRETAFLFSDFSLKCFDFLWRIKFAFLVVRYVHSLHLNCSPCCFLQPNKTCSMSPSRVEEEKGHIGQFSCRFTGVNLVF